MNTIKLVSIEGRWGQAIYPPSPPIPKMGDLLPERGPLRPQAVELLNILMIRNQERVRYAKNS